ncbi:GNAT family N-acetyltransferase [Micromonospora sp. NPDC047753]|uniref:GNAT family N-acetyltransferase n=1 Tax=Micromonospora sp. NPDC047753 TaxID=3154817 RepID=UPI0033C7B5F5
MGGLLFTAEAPTHHVHWLVVAEQSRGQSVGRALMTAAVRRFVPGSGSVDVVTFGADHPGARVSGARASTSASASPLPRPSIPVRRAVPGRSSA